MAIAYDYYPLVLTALDLVSQGRTITDACDEVFLPVAMYEKYTAADPSLMELRVDAERRGHDALRDALVNIDNHKIHGQSNPQMAKVISDNIKWVLSKSDPKRFGDRIEVKHEITVDRAIIEALGRAKNRTDFLTDTRGTVIEGSVSREVVEIIEDAIYDDEDMSFLD